LIAKLNLENFAKFGELNIDFSSKINIIIGENGTGKTQLLKAAYVANTALALGQEQSDLTEKLCSTFRPNGDALGKLVRNGTPGGQHAKINAEFGHGQRLSAEFTASSKKVKLLHLSNESGGLNPPIFLPTKEVLSLYKGITNDKSDKPTLLSLFDATYLDLCKKLSVKRPIKLEDAIEQDPRFGQVFQKLVNTIEGRFRLGHFGHTTFDPGHFEEQRAKDQHQLNTRTKTVFMPIKGETISAQMAAEGVRKLGIIQLLLENQQLNLGASGTLFWDEPETNMNPKFMRLLVEVLLELARNGQQIVLATHDYVLLKWFDLLADKGKGDHVQYHALYRAEGLSGIKIESVDAYHLLDKNAISNVFSDLYDAEIDRSLGAKK
jgi:energy-coupling factor transporter ATP-binding protein EcfA2